MYKNNDILILKITKDKIYFNSIDFIQHDQIFLELSSVSEIEYFNNNFDYIKVKVSGLKDKELKCFILDFNSREIANFNYQIFYPLEIEKLFLSGSDTMKLLSLAKRKQKNIIKNESIKSFISEYSENRKLEVSIKKNEVIQIQKQIEFEYSFNNLVITDNLVIAKNRIKIEEINQVIDLIFEIENSFVKKEFDSIKNYFRNQLKLKTIIIKSQILINGKAVTVIKSQSEEIDRITPELINEIKYSYIKKELLSSEDNSISTVDQLFQKQKNNIINAETFNIDDKKFIKDLIAIKKPKHFHHIEYLSELHNYSALKLRVLNNPLSFMFFTTSKNNCYIIWETLFGTDGTYIWGMGKNIDEFIKDKSELKAKVIEMENDIRNIKIIGRDKYLQNKPENFVRIFHNYKDFNGFEIWKKTLEKHINS